MLDAAEHTRKVSELGPTQTRVYTTIKSWAQQNAGTAPLRLLVLGTAGTGKTFTLKCTVEAARAIFKSFNSVLMVAHTGVAAANMGGGATTINSVFKFASNNMEEDLDGDRLNELVESLSKTRLIIVDEISTVGSAQLEMISKRLD